MYNEELLNIKSELSKAIKLNEVEKVKSILDNNLSWYSDNIDFLRDCAKTVYDNSGIFDEFDSGELVSDKDQWNEEYFYFEKSNQYSNFAYDRYMHLIDVVNLIENKVDINDEFEESTYEIKDAKVDTQSDEYIPIENETILMRKERRKGIYHKDKTINGDYFNNNSEGNYNDKIDLINIKSKKTFMVINKPRKFENFNNIFIAIKRKFDKIRLNRNKGTSSVRVTNRMSIEESESKKKTNKVVVACGVAGIFTVAVLIKKSIEKHNK